MKLESHKYNDFLYKRNHQNRLTPVIVEHTKKKPESLYKFYGLSKHNVEAVSEGYLHASHPFDLNETRLFL